MTEAIKFEGMTLEQYEAYIASRNVAWRKASKQRKRVWLAKDVLAQLDAKYFKPIFNVYLDQTSAAKCEGCALGGMLAACTLRDESPGCLYDRANSGVEPSTRRTLLGAFFDSVQLAQIEVAFEGKTGVAACDLSKLPEIVTASEWTKGFCLPGVSNECVANRRMRLIMANIINNHGTFDTSKPPSDKDYKVAGLTRGTPKDANV